MTTSSREPLHLHSHPLRDSVAQAANDASNPPKIIDPTLSPASDLKNVSPSHILSAWHHYWKNQSHNKPKLILWSSSNRNPRQVEVFLSRLRINPTRVTHAHLLLGHKSPSPIITTYCHTDYLSVQWLNPVCVPSITWDARTDQIAPHAKIHVVHVLRRSKHLFNFQFEFQGMQWIY